MCGIIAVLPIYDDAPPSDGGDHLLAVLSSASSASATISQGTATAITHALDDLNALLRQAVDVLSSWPARGDLVVNSGLREEVNDHLVKIESHLTESDAWLDEQARTWSTHEVDQIQKPLRQALDLSWTLREDRVRAAERVRHLAGVTDDSALESTFGLSTTIAYFALDTVLDGIDRLEIRGRDSAGVHIWVSLEEAQRASLPPTVWQRGDNLFRSGTFIPVTDGLSIVYKTASIVGRLGDNVAALRAEIAQDADLRAVLRCSSARVSILAHTRWASVGKVSSANAHPLNGLSKEGAPSRYAVAALNGDIDNHTDLREREGVPLDSDITTDAKLIPTMAANRLSEEGTDGAQALRDCLDAYEGSMAIALQTSNDPDQLLLGVKGGGQGLYVGLSPSGYVAASEVFGLVSHTDRYIRINHPNSKSTSTVVSVDRHGRGSLAGVHRLDEAGVSHEVNEGDVRTAEVTTRDVARGSYERYLEKELAEAPASFRKTLRGRVHDDQGLLTIDLPDSAMPASVRQMLRDKLINEILFIGQGTAAVAAAGSAHIVESLLDDTIRVWSLPATELSAWHLHRDLRRTCLVAMSQSGTTTDTNRAVDLARERGATVLSIVNRRDSDLVNKADGVLYTSDGRDIEMAVASTKAFYAQAAAGMLLGIGFAKELGLLDAPAEDSHLQMLAEIPSKLEELERGKAAIAALAEQVACAYPYWSVLGSGPNRVAAAEVRIKLSELCYRGVSSDAVEDKKHIDLSAESLVLLCAAGTPATQLQDLVKEVEIFAAHRNRTIVIVDEGTKDQWPTDLVIEVPRVHPNLAWVLSTAAGHLFAYYAALAIDSAADDLRDALANLDHRHDGGRGAAAASLGRFLDDCRNGRYRGVLTSDTVLQLANARWLLDGTAPLDAIPDDLHDPRAVIQEALTAAISDLTRSIDSIRHQAKTVTVGTSRTGVDLFDNPLSRAALELGIDRNSLSYPTLLALRGYSPLVKAIHGATRYLITGTMADPHIRVLAKSGVAEHLRSRAEEEVSLAGTKRLAADTRLPRLERGLSDDRLVLIIPEILGNRVGGITLLHIELASRASATDLMAALEHQGARLAELQAAITERNRPFEPKELAELPAESVLLAPIEDVAAAIVG